VVLWVEGIFWTNNNCYTEIISNKSISKGIFSIILIGRIIIQNVINDIHNAGNNTFCTISAGCLLNSIN